ncbi:MAG: hypothetical protein OEU36_03130 [Gammaproteobacteria bacterium]|nr:hypothetical protein [Gammaproteobacteria bacterium]
MPDPAEKVRVNLVIPEINFESLYGGYIAKLNLAKRIDATGRNVRFIIVDQCDYREDKLRTWVAEYEGLADLFDHVEVAYCFDRGCAIRMNPRDVVIATTWWTAYVANDALKFLNANKFIYLIQEYEPYTFPMGSYYAAAHASYSCPHVPAYSSLLLQEFFELNGFGVYGHGYGEACGTSFENAILSFDLDEGAMSARTPRRVLFYARPEAHATRNMFETGFMSLAFAIERGMFASEPWEFYGIGTNHGDILLPKNNCLRMLGKVGLQEYRRLLPMHDLGISLMYTPHPSLLPMEMAAAGLIVVTNTCQNKTRQKMESISRNIVAAEPTVEGIVTGLGEALGKVDKYDQRLEGARVNWSSSWDDTFSDSWLEALIRQVTDE